LVLFIAVPRLLKGLVELPSPPSLPLVATLKELPVTPLTLITNVKIKNIAI
jgi:hypothetical protein